MDTRPLIRSPNPIPAPTFTAAAVVTSLTLDDSTCSFADNSDSTKKLKFECSGITTGTTRTVTVPNANFTVVGTDTSQALSNKTYDGLTIAGGASSSLVVAASTVMTVNGGVPFTMTVSSPVSLTFPITDGLVPVQVINVNSGNTTISTSGTGPFAVFTSARDTITLAGATTYFIEGVLKMSTGTTLHTTSLLFGGTFTVTSMGVDVESYSCAAVNTVTAASNDRTFVTQQAATVVTTATALALTVIKFSGFIRVNSGGTFIPQVAFSVDPVGTNSLDTNSYIKLTHCGGDTMAQTAGDWF